MAITRAAPTARPPTRSAVMKKRSGVWKVAHAGTVRSEYTWLIA
ncbi:Uncharacterised protein [Mycobacteroides abscessus subsp. abscessus]|nr:Uncharacterised protein [Mycobacteroides abscessus subsp. abscessus]